MWSILGIFKWLRSRRIRTQTDDISARRNAGPRTCPISKNQWRPVFMSEVFLPWDVHLLFLLKPQINSGSSRRSLLLTQRIITTLCVQPHRGQRVQTQTVIDQSFWRNRSTRSLRAVRSGSLLSHTMCVASSSSWMSASSACRCRMWPSAVSSTFTSEIPFCPPRRIKHSERWEFRHKDSFYTYSVCTELC